jgi:hypothetical protein
MIEGNIVDFKNQNPLGTCVNLPIIKNKIKPYLGTAPSPSPLSQLLKIFGNQIAV